MRKAVPMIPALLAAALAAAPVAAADASKALDGEWIVDLATDPAKPYTQPMSLSLRADGTVSGSFYQSAIEAGRWREDRGRTCVSFRTSDGKGPYHTAACLSGNRVEGQTWAEHRDFLFNWNATRAAASP